MPKARKGKRQSQPAYSPIRSTRKAARIPGTLDWTEVSPSSRRVARRDPIRYSPSAALVGAGVAKAAPAARVRRELPNLTPAVQRIKAATLSLPKGCARKKSVRRAVILATGKGGRNNVRVYKARKFCK